MSLSSLKPLASSLLTELKLSSMASNTPWSWFSNFDDKNIISNSSCLLPFLLIPPQCSVSYTSFFTADDLIQFSSAQLLSRVWLFVNLWTATHQASLSITISQSSLKLMSIELVMPSNHLILCRHLLLLPSMFLNIRIFSNKSVLCIKWPKYWSFSFNISPSNEYWGLISFRIDQFDLPVLHRTLKSDFIANAIGDFIAIV